MKQGRNDLCGCGSGKKFKKCCIDKLKPLLRSRRPKVCPLCESGHLFDDCCRQSFQSVVEVDDAIGRNHILQYEEEQKKQDWSKPLEPLPVIEL